MKKIKVLIGLVIAEIIIIAIAMIIGLGVIFLVSVFVAIGKELMPFLVIDFKEMGQELNEFYGPLATPIKVLVWLITGSVLFVLNKEIVPDYLESYYFQIGEHREGESKGNDVTWSDLCEVVKEEEDE